MLEIDADQLLTHWISQSDKLHEDYTQWRYTQWIFMSNAKIPNDYFCQMMKEMPSDNLSKMLIADVSMTIYAQCWNTHYRTINAQFGKTQLLDISIHFEK